MRRRICRRKARMGMCDEGAGTIVSLVGQGFLSCRLRVVKLLIVCICSLL
jgi:hypothetical protein